MSAIEKMEERIAALEADVIKLKEGRTHGANSRTEHVWLDKIFGSFANDADYLEAMRLGREYEEPVKRTKSKAKRKKRAHVDS